MKLIYLLLFLLPFIGMGQNQLLVNGLPYDSVCGRIIIVNYFKLDTIYSDKFGIEKVEIVDDCINFQVAYGGGCGKTNFELICDYLIEDSQPPGTNFVLKLEDNDNCKALIHNNISFDLSPFKKYALDSGIYLKIKGTKFGLLYKK